MIFSGDNRKSCKLSPQIVYCLIFFIKYSSLFLLPISPVKIKETFIQSKFSFKCTTSIPLYFNLKVHTCDQVSPGRGDEFL